MWNFSMNNLLFPIWQTGLCSTLPQALLMYEYIKLTTSEHVFTHSEASCTKQIAHLSAALQSCTVTSLWNSLWNSIIDSVTVPGRVRHKVILLDERHCWVYKQPNGIKSPCSAALSRKLLRLKSVFLEARYCINLWWKKKRKEESVIWCCSLTTSSHVHTDTLLLFRPRICRLEMQLYEHFTEAELLLRQKQS